ncbi:hypothetical protein [Pseudomonas chlororaphis]|uniref:hypothetical protein n=1 Tax=Pseudomonas chlororaphis TaxID=587753 RepID=UPI000D10BD41|nr:hypothetical protein [Pseudomonas chlororaphis]AVO59196.1 hypothetical protein C6Q18_14900 [Pseudomonas chlororaphis subsp. piscium]
MYLGIKVFNMTISDNQTMPPDFQAFTSLDDGCLQTGRYLGLDGPVSRAVFTAIIDNPTYATTLFTARTAPAFRDHLLAHPQPAQRLENSGETHPLASDESSRSSSIELSNSALLAKAARSFVAWGRGGFKTTDNDLFERRLSACEACPHHTATPDKLAYRVGAALTGDSNRKICELCGCVTGKKARLRDEQCPGAHPDRPGYSRWGDPLTHVQHAGTIK